MIPAAPKLRFPEFKDPWKPGHAGDAFKNSRAKGAAGLPIYSVTMDRGLVRRDSMDRHMAADAADGQNLRAQRGDVVYNMMRMWQGAVGLAPEECMVSPAYVVLSPKKHTSPQFFDQWFKGKRMLYLLGAYSHGITSDRLRLYADDFARIPLHLPSLPEQQKIAAFLGVVDAKLAALAAKQAALGRFKAGLMQKLFSQQLRFPRDDGQAFPDWQEKRLRELSSFISKGTTPTSVGFAFCSEGVNFIKAESINDSYTIIPNKVAKVSPECHDQLKRSQLQENDILFSIAGTLGRTAIVPKGILPANTNQALSIIRLKCSREVIYVNQFLNSRQISKRIGELVSVGAQPNLSLEQVGGLIVPYPHPDEQQKIADALTVMDAKIQSVADHVTKLEVFKKGLLQQMFV